MAKLFALYTVVYGVKNQQFSNESVIGSIRFVYAT